MLPENTVYQDANAYVQQGSYEDWRYKMQITKETINIEVWLTEWGGQYGSFYTNYISEAVARWELQPGNVEIPKMQRGPLKALESKLMKTAKSIKFPKED